MPHVAWQRRQRAARRAGPAILTAPESGDYRFRFDSQERLPHLDRRHSWSSMHGASATRRRSPPARSRSRPAARYPIRVEGFQRGARGDERLVWSLPERPGRRRRVAAAREADLVVFVGGLSARIEGEEMRSRRRASPAATAPASICPRRSSSCSNACSATGKPVVLVLMNGSALGVNWADAHVPAIVEAWYPGERGRHRGRRPDRRRLQPGRPAAGDLLQVGRPAAGLRGLCDGAGAPIAISTASRFTRSATASATPASLCQRRASQRAGRRPRTTGHRLGRRHQQRRACDGDEVVQLYLTHPGVAGAPIRALRASSASI